MSGMFSYYIADVNGHKIGDLEETVAIITYAKRSGVLQKEGTTWSTGKRQFKNLKEVHDLFSKDAKLLKLLKDKTLAAVLSDAMASGEDADGGDGAEEVVEEVS